MRILEQLLRRFPGDKEIRKLQSWIEEEKKR